MKRISRALAVLSLVAMVAVAPQVAAAAKAPSQNEKAALRRATERDTGTASRLKEARISTVDPDWAFAVAIVGTGNHKAQAGAIYERQGGRWELVVDDPFCGSIVEAGVPLKVQIDLGLGPCR
jgi:hypothetical protein